MHFSFIPSFFSQVRRLALIALPFLIAFSAATMNTNAFAGGVFSPTSSSISLPEEITVPGNYANGSTLWKSTATVFNLRAVLNTAFEYDVEKAVVAANVQSGSKTPGYNNVYSTNIPGIGIRWWATWRGPSAPSGRTMPITTESENHSGALGYFWNVSSHPQDVWIELVKTGSVSAGVLTGSGMNVDMRFQCPSCTAGNVNLSGRTRVVVGPSCSVAASTISVPMGAVPILRFTGLQSTSIPQHFDITLECKGGAPESVLRPHITLTDANDTSNQSTVLTLSQTAPDGKPVATGIGIQILKDGTALGYGPDSNVPGNTNQWSAGTIVQGVAQFKIPLTAKYVQTAAAVTTGQANGRATFTLNYQ